MSIILPSEANVSGGTGCLPTSVAQPQESSSRRFAAPVDEQLRLPAAASCSVVMANASRFDRSTMARQQNDGSNR